MTPGPESLRGRIVEAGARELHEIMSRRGPTDLTFDVAYPDEQAHFLRVTANVVDVVLDVLAVHAGEWSKAGRHWDSMCAARNVGDVGYVWRLLAVLREYEPDIGEPDG